MHMTVRHAVRSCPKHCQHPSLGTCRALRVQPILPQWLPQWCFALCALYCTVNPREVVHSVCRCRCAGCRPRPGSGPVVGFRLGLKLLGGGERSWLRLGVHSHSPFDKWRFGAEARAHAGATHANRLVFSIPTPPDSRVFTSAVSYTRGMHPPPSSVLSLIRSATFPTNVE